MKKKLNPHFSILTIMEHELAKKHGREKYWKS